MKKIFILLTMALLGSVFLSPMLAMDKLTNAERKEILYCIGEFRTFQQWNSEGSAEFLRKKEDFQRRQLNIIDEILDKYQIEYPKEKTWLWLKKLRKNIRCNKEDLKRFSETGECINCLLSYVDLREIINSLNDRNMSINLEGTQLYKVNLSGTDLSNANFEGAGLYCVNLSNANLKDIIITSETMVAGADVTNAKFNKKALDYNKQYCGGFINENYATVYTNEDDLKKFKETGKCTNCHLTDLDLRDIIKSLNNRDLPIDLHSAWLDNSDLSNANLSNANLSNARLKNVNLSNSDLTNANMRLAYLQNTSLNGANLSNANLSDIYTNGPYRSCGIPRDNPNINMSEEERAIDRAKKKRKNSPLLDGNLIKSNEDDSVYIDLSEANLTNASLWGAMLKYANLTNANLTNADLEYANLKYANLQGAILRFAHFGYTRMKKTNLNEANITGANLNEAKGVSLDGTIMDGLLRKNINACLNFFGSKRSY